MSRFVQRIVRTWTFIGLYTGLTAYWWLAHPPPGGWVATVRDDQYPWGFWTSCASLLALWIENMIGLGQLDQQHRDTAMMGSLAEMLRAVQAQTNAILRLLREEDRDA